MDSTTHREIVQNRGEVLVQPEGDINIIGSSSNPTAPVQSLSNVQIGVGNINIVGRDIVHIHHHHHGTAQNQPDIMSVLQRVPNFRDIQLANLRKATAGTGDWIDEWQEFCTWLAPGGHIRFLWGSGMPGAGKSILASLVINRVEVHAKASTTAICVCYLFIRYSDNIKFTLRDLLEVLVKQTIERHPDALAFCKDVYARHIHENTEPSAGELIELLRRVTSELMASTYYFLDALDEAPADVQLELLESLTSLKAKLFVTSRPLKILEPQFPEAYHFPIVAQDSDLEIHIGKEMSRSKELQDILAKATPGLGGRITLIIKQKCSGMFLHASLQLQALRECTSRRDVETTLHNFPPKIKDVYIQTWTRIARQPSVRASLAINVLTWVLYATRSLTVDELRHAIASFPDTYGFDRTGLVSVEMIIGVCCGLLVIEKETGLVRLIHYSAKAVLQTLLLQSNPHPHSLLAATCIARLRDGGFQRSPLASAEDFEVALRSTPLLMYAYHAWPVHGRESIHDPIAKSRLLDFVQGCHAFPILPRERGTFDRFGPLHVLAAFDLPLSLASSDQLRSPNPPSQEQGLTPLHLACMRKSRLSAKELLALPRILVNSPDKDGSTPLIWASWTSSGGDTAIVELLLLHPKIKVNQSNSAGQTPLGAAVGPGRISALRLLLAHPKVKVNQADTRGRTPFMMACTSRPDIETINLFLAHRKLNVNTADKVGTTALMWMLMTGAPELPVDTLKAILAHPKIDPGLLDKSGKPAAYWAHRCRRKDLLDLLLSHPKAQRR